MSYIDELIQQSRQMKPTGQDVGLPSGVAYSSYYPTWETTTPQYIQPNPYQTAQSAFRVNEFVYSIIIKRAMAEAKGHFRVNLNTGKHPEEIKDHSLRRLIRRPNKNMTENDFWGIKRISQDIAGFAAFEIEYNKLGEPLRLWFMRPDWCSFMRGQQDPLAYIRYQPYGLQPNDVPLVDQNTGKSKILFFSNAEDFDPIFPGVKFYSPAMHCLNQIEFDNAMTFFLHDFVKHGARPGGLLSVTQTIDANVAEDYQRRWVEQHGGSENWNKPVVLGLGSTYQPVQMNFKDMAFGELDARSETRICNAFQIETIVADARAGLDVSSYNNKAQAQKDWYYNWVTDTWDTNAEIMHSQMIPIYEDNPDNFMCDFDVSRVYIMQEDRTTRWTRAVSAWEKKLITRNDALEEAGMPMVEDGDLGMEYYQNTSASPDSYTDNMTGNGVNALGATDVTANPSAEITPKKIEKDAVEKAAEESEVKDFRKYAKNRVRHNEVHLIPMFEFKFVPESRQRELLCEFGVEPIKNKDEHTQALYALADAINKAVGG